MCLFLFYRVLYLKKADYKNWTHLQILDSRYITLN
jgi:hypothetical protein